MKTFFESYRDEIIENYKLKYKKVVLDENDYEYIDKFINEKIMPLYNPVDIYVSNTTLTDPDAPPVKKDFLQLYDTCRKEGKVFSLSHGVYNNEKSQYLDIWDEQLIRRNEFKVKMKDALKALNFILVHLNNGYQRVFKENANAIYGASGEENFTFYDINSISNLTGTCYYTLLTTINQIEKVLGNRVILRSDQELFDYLIYLNKKPYNEIINMKDDFLDSLVNNINSNDNEFVYEQILSYCKYYISDEVKENLKHIIDGIFESEDNYRKLIFKYNSNLKKLSSETDIFNIMINNDFENYISETYDEHKFKEKNVNIRKILNTFVYDDFLQSELLDLCDNYKRSTVMLSDTDSTFCVSTVVFDNIVKSLKEECSSKGFSFNSELDYAVNAFKIIMFIGESMSRFFLDKLGGSEYQNSMDNRWSLKSEFLYDRILLLKVKKTYTGSIVSQEGIRLKPKKIDHKNNEIVRSLYSSLTKDFLKDILIELLMKDDSDASIYKILEILENHKEKLNKTLMNHVECSKLGTRADFKSEAAYKNDAISVWQYKAAVTFNALFPEVKTMKSDKTMIMPIKGFKEPKVKFLVNIKELEKIGLSEEQIKYINKNKTDDEKIDYKRFINKFELNTSDNKILKKLDKEYSKFEFDVVSSWYIETYGKNDDLKERFTNLFNLENKTDSDMKLINKLIEDKGISYLAFNYYSSMPESMLCLVDTDSLRLKTIDDRMSRILDALRFKVYSKSNNKKYSTNILTI